MTCDICKREKRTKRADKHLIDALPFKGIIEYFTPIWEKWHLCADCMSDVVYMLLAIRDTLHGVGASITVEDFKRHADALDVRIHAHTRTHASVKGVDA